MCIKLKGFYEIVGMESQTCEMFATCVCVCVYAHMHTYVHVYVCVKFLGFMFQIPLFAFCVKYCLRW